MREARQQMSGMVPVVPVVCVPLAVVLLVAGATAAGVVVELLAGLAAGGLVVVAGAVWLARATDVDDRGWAVCLPAVRRSSKDLGRRLLPWVLATVVVDVALTVRGDPLAAVWAVVSVGALAMAVYAALAPIDPRDQGPKGEQR